MFGAFVSGIGLFAVVRLGGIPVPNTCAGVWLWFLVVAIQFIEYLLVFLSLVSVVLGYFHTRYYYRECMYEWGSVPLMDICSILTVLVVPVVVQSLFVLFIYAYVFSTCLKVWNASKGRTRTEGVGDGTEESVARLEDFKRNLTHAKQPYPIATIHVWLAYLGLSLTLLISIPTGGLFASMVLWCAKLDFGATCRVCADSEVCTP